MGREEWHLAQKVEEALELGENVLRRIDRLEHDGEPDPEDDRMEMARGELAFYADQALRHIAAMADRLSIPSIVLEVGTIRSQLDLSETDRYFEFQIFSPALDKAKACFKPLSAMTDVSGIAPQDIFRNILCRTAQVIDLLKVSPANESDVRNACLSVCRIAFPDTRREIGIPQIVKNYKGDLGVPSLRTMAEFKFVDSRDEMKVSLDGVFADMRGYKCPDWDTFYGVFYMTGPYYTQEDVELQFRDVKADVSWKPIVLQGSGARAKRSKG